MKTNIPTPPLEEIEIMLSAAIYWLHAEPDEDHPNPKQDSEECLNDAYAAIVRILEKQDGKFKTNKVSHSKFAL
jgi:hypothetical protein